jgi:putative ABC transport system permease protein
MAEGYRMRPSDLIRLSCGYALRRRWRAVPSLIGVALGVTVLVVVLSAAQAIQTTGGQDVLGQQSLKQITVTSASGARQGGITLAVVTRLNSLRHVVAAYPVATVNEVGVAGASGYVVPLQNLPAPPDRPPLVTGRWAAAGEITLADSGLVDKAGKPTRGTSLMGVTLSLQVRSYQGLGPETSIPLTVVGVYRDVASAGQPIPGYALLALVTHLQALEASQSDTQYAATAQYPECIVDADAVDSVTALGNSIQAQGLQANYVDKQVPGLTGHLEGVQVTAAYVALLVIVLCALSVGNQVSSSVRQRRAELGIMLAIGFRQRMLAGMVAGEALATGIAGALLGISIAVVGIVIFGALQPSAGAAIPWASLPAVVTLSGLLCLIAGILPARRVMRLDCVTAIRAE